MSRWNPCRRSEFIRRLRNLGFAGVLLRSEASVYDVRAASATIPSNVEYSVPQLRMMVREVEQILGREISADEWDTLS